MYNWFIIYTNFVHSLLIMFYNIFLQKAVLKMAHIETGELMFL